MSGISQVAAPNFVDIVAVIADIASIIGVLGLFAALATALVAYKDYRTTQKRASLENAVRLTRIYEQEILGYIFWIRNVFISSHMNDFIKEHLNIESLKTVRFTKSEMINISNKKDISFLFETEFSKIDLGIIHHRKNLFTTNELPRTTETEWSGEDSEIRKNYTLFEFRHEIYKLLNSLEWFAMNFTKNIADEDAVYQSLHQVFISCIQYLYYFISNINETAYGKFYTNIIELYNIWNKRLVEKAAAEVTKLLEIRHQAEEKTANLHKEIEHTGTKL